jgi:hypothetical protein
MVTFFYGCWNQKGMTNQPMSVQEIDSILPPGSYYFSGNEAATEGAIAAGCRYYGGYPITPSSEIMEQIAVRLKEVGGVFMQMEDEIGSICSVIGAVWAGATSPTLPAISAFGPVRGVRGMGACLWRQIARFGGSLRRPFASSRCSSLRQASVL